jgi:hypothetical protein
VLLALLALVTAYSRASKVETRTVTVIQKGLSGPRGATGSTGKRGLAGKTGTSGLPGTQGAPGPAGTSADTADLEAQISNLQARLDELCSAGLLRRSIFPGKLDEVRC